MSEKIIISFDDEKPGKAEEKIIINLKAEKKENPKETIQKSVISTYYRGNPQLTGFESSSLKYPEGLENGFRKIFSVKLNDVFLNSILLNNRFAIFSSASGNVYFIDRFSGNLYSKHSLASESFEKTGIVTENNVYLNSIKSFFYFDIKTDIIKERKLYEARDGFYIWSNLNKIKDKIVFLEYSPSKKAASLKSYCVLTENKEQPGVKSYCEIYVSHHLFDSLIIYDEYIFVFYDDRILKFSNKDFSVKEYELNFNINPDTNFLLLEGKIYFNNKNNELFYFDTTNGDIKFTGIKCMYINSFAGFSDNIIVGTLNGWNLYKTSGVLVFSYEDIEENKIETLNRNILSVSNANKIIFHNLNRFHEAEGFTISPGAVDSDSDKIISARIGDDSIFVLSKSGILEEFNNDKLNLLLD